MSGTISFNPYGTSQPQNSFLSQTQGYVQGVAYDDPSVRMELERGILASTETVVMWGGIPVSELINTTGTGADGIGPVLKRSTSQATVTGISVFNQAHSMVIVPGASTPTAAINNFVAFYRFQSNARIAVACDPALISAITGAGDGILSQALYWDVTNYRITLTTSGGNFALPTSVKLLSTNGNSKIVTYSNSAANWTTGSAAIIQI